MFCPNCGNVSADDQRFCQNCGALLIQPETQQPEVQQPEVQQPEVYQSQTQPIQQPEYQQYPYPQQPCQPQPMQVAPVVPAKGMGITSMVLGIVALALFCVWYIALPCAIVGVILGGLALSKAKAAGAKNGMAVAGVVCSCVALGIAIILMIATISACTAATNIVSSSYGF